MCGIAGIIGNGIQEAEVEKMLVSIAHRGPDARGIYEDKGFAVLGHNRLSIIDLSHQADQPFYDPTGRYHLNYNGEIYNYKEIRAEIGAKYNFRTHSDTEVLLASFILYGKNCLEKLNGMFAFAIWDSKEKKLFAARDRFGVKPFYYSIDSSKFIFASEIKAIRCVKSAGPNEKVWANYFYFGTYGAPTETFYNEIVQLPAGHFIEYKDSNLSIKKWYDFPERIKNISNNHSKGQMREIYLKLLEDSIKLRFRADVEVGFNLSGGVDSSLLLALVNHFFTSKNIKAYTFYTGDNSYDELPWVEKMISKTGNPLEKVKLSYKEVPELARLITDFQEEPFGGVPTLAYSKIFKRASKQGVKVLLDGQGMDEQWAGYDYYRGTSNSLIQGSKDQMPTKKHILNEDFCKLSRKPDYPVFFGSRIQNLQYRDLFYTKLPRALRFNDRISMAFSTELREPFLDYRLVEYAFSLADEFKIKNGTHKYLLRELVKDLVPKDISYAPKRPLQTPQREWLGENLSTWAENRIEVLINGNISEWFNKNEIKKEWQKYKKGDRQNSFHIWQWINASIIM